MLAAGILALAVTPMTIRLAKRLGVMDQPGKDGTETARHLHTEPTPRMGGLGIICGFLGGMLLFAAVDRQMAAMLLGSVIIVVVGTMDDIHDLKAYQKLAAQFLCAAIAVMGGNCFAFPGYMTAGAGVSRILLKWIAVLASVIWIVLVTNAMNMIDGLDGLAAGITVAATVSITILALACTNYGAAVLAAALGGGCIGFLPYNLFPAKTFMGDNGSNFIGYTLAVASLQTFFQFDSVTAFVLPFLVLGLPIFDICYAVILRISHGENPMKADRKHVHYQLIDMGFSKKQTVAILWSISAGLELLALTAAFFDLGMAMLLLVIMGAAGTVFAKQLLKVRETISV